MPIYLDHNATTPVADEVLEAMMPYLSGIYGNPSSVHRYGRLARNALDQARSQVASLVGAESNQVVFTSGGSEANNLAIKGSLMGLKPGNLVISSIEHACLMEPAEYMQSQGWELRKVAVSEQGTVVADDLLRKVGAQTRFVSVMAANNETGAIQDIKSLVASVKSINPEVWFHTDACQIAGKLPVDFAQLQLDMMSLSSHKLYGPQGAGALVVRRNIDLKPQILGGGQESGLRSGTENLAAIVGFGAAAELALNKLDERKQHGQALQRQLLEVLKQMQGVTVFAEKVEKLPNTLQFSVQGIDGEALLMELDRKGFAVSSGSACHSEQTEPSHVLLAMGIDELTAKGAIRASFGDQNTSDQVQQFIDALVQVRQQFN